MSLSEWLAAGRKFDLQSTQLDRYGYAGDIEDTAAVIEWLRDHPNIDFPVWDDTGDVPLRPNQFAFRRRVYEAWGGKCAITGCAIPDVLDAAHIGGPGAWRTGNDAGDGILLRVDLHRLYDAGKLTIDKDGRISCGVPDYEWVDGLVVRRGGGA